MKKIIEDSNNILAINWDHVTNSINDNFSGFLHVKNCGENTNLSTILKVTMNDSYRVSCNTFMQLKKDISELFEHKFHFEFMFSSIRDSDNKISYVIYLYIDVI